MTLTRAEKDERHRTVGLGVVLAYAGEISRLGDKIGGIGDLWVFDPDMFRALKDAGQALREAGKRLDALTEARIDPHE